VNASGAAVAAWEAAVGFSERTYISYRNAAGDGWISPDRVRFAASVSQVGIDDAGRVLMLYHPVRGASMEATRRTAAGEWLKPQRVPASGLYHTMAVGAGGAAVVSYSRQDAWFTSRMSQDGTWAAPLRQPPGRDSALRPVDLDAKGRALLAWWDGTDLMVRWSRPDGRWHTPYVLAADVSKPGPYPELHVHVNRRGDALVVWRAKGQVRQLWARYRPAGQDWTKPVKITSAASPPMRWYHSVVALGDRGHVAVAWAAHDRIQVFRASPTRD
jgi:hypothetical protein